MDELLLKMDGEMEVRGLRELTRATYLRQVSKFGEHFGRNPGELGLEEVERYLLYLTRERGLSASSRNQCAGALRFFFGTTLRRGEWVTQLPFARVSKKLPLVLSGTEVERLLGSFDAVTHRTVATLCYGAVERPEGAIVGEIYQTTTLKLRLPHRIPELILEQEGLLDRALELAGFQDIDFKHFTHFSTRFVLKGPNEAAIREFMSPELLRFFEHEEVYHVESSGPELVIFRTFMRRATATEVERMLAFSERLVRLLAR